MTANPDQGWRVAPKPGAELERTQAGRFALPLEVTFDGEHQGSSSVVFTGGELEAYYHQMRAHYARDLAGVDYQHPDRAALKAEMGGGF